MNRIVFYILSLVIASCIAVTNVAAQQTTTKQTQVTVDDKGFHPSSISVHVNVPVKLASLRTTDKTCATAVVLLDYKIRRPSSQKPTVVELTPNKTEEIKFLCGMGMFSRKLVVTAN